MKNYILILHVLTVSALYSAAAEVTKSNVGKRLIESERTVPSCFKFGDSTIGQYEISTSACDPLSQEKFADLALKAHKEGLPLAICLGQVSTEGGFHPVIFDLCNLVRTYGKNKAGVFEEDAFADAKKTDATLTAAFVRMFGDINVAACPIGSLLIGLDNKQMASLTVCEEGGHEENIISLFLRFTLAKDAVALKRLATLAATATLCDDEKIKVENADTAARQAIFWLERYRMEVAEDVEVLKMLYQLYKKIGDQEMELELFGKLIDIDNRAFKALIGPDLRRYMGLDSQETMEENRRLLDELTQKLSHDESPADQPQ